MDQDEIALGNATILPSLDVTTNTFACILAEVCNRLHLKEYTALAPDGTRKVGRGRSLEYEVVICRELWPVAHQRLHYCPPVADLFQKHALCSITHNSDDQCDESRICRFADDTSAPS